MDAIATARTLAAAHPAAMLPCPICAASLKAENVERHLGKVHPDARNAETRWAGKGALGLAPVQLSLDGDAVVLRHWLGLATRRVTLPCAIEVGALWGERMAAPMGAPETTEAATPVRTGRYLRLVGDDASITIGATQSTQFPTHWARRGWREGGKRRGCDIRVPVTAMLALEYLLASRALLVPAT